MRPVMLGEQEFARRRAARREGSKPVLRGGLLEQLLLNKRRDGHPQEGARRAALAKAARAAKQYERRLGSKLAKDLGDAKATLLGTSGPLREDLATLRQG